MNIVISSRQFSLAGQYWADHFLLIALCFSIRGSGLGLIWMDWYVIVSWHLVHTEKVEQLCSLNAAVKYSEEQGRVVYCSPAWLGMATLPCCSVYVTPDIYIPLPVAWILLNPLCSHSKDETCSLVCVRDFKGLWISYQNSEKKFPSFPTFPHILHRSCIFSFTELTES